MDFINEVLESTASFEAPRRFYYWGALACISAVLKDRVYFDMGGNYKTYPNIYVLLYGPSGIRKGPPIALAEDLVSRVNNTRVIDGRSSIEAVIKELGTITTTPSNPVPTKDACGFMVASELSSSIIGNPSAMDVMTNLYDRLYNEKDWKYRLKGEGSVQLSKPTITWFSGTNEALFRDFMPEKNLHGGLIGRMFVISEYKKHRSNSLMFKTTSPDKMKLSNILKHIAALQGEFIMSEDVRRIVDTWYEKWDNQVAPGLKDESGFVSRVLDFIIKGSMLIAAGRRLSKEIILSDIQESTEIILPLVAPTKNVIAAIRRQDVSLTTKRGMVLTFITNQPEFKAERIKILQHLGLHLDHEDLNKIIEHMMQANVIEGSNHAGTVTYRLKIERPEVKAWIEQYRK